MVDLGYPSFCVCGRGPLARLGVFGSPAPYPALVPALVHALVPALFIAIVRAGAATR